MTTAEAMEKLEHLAATHGWFWHAARGRVRPDEPLYGIGVFLPGDLDDEITAEGETFGEAVENLEKAIAQRKH